MLLSFIVPVYNVETYLEKCLESFINQSEQNFEVIAVNDGSLDNSLKILEEYQKKMPNLRIISQKNKGLSGARNTGLKNAKGEYIAFVDSDDYIDRNYCKIIHKTIQKNPSLSLIEFNTCNVEDEVKIYTDIFDTSEGLITSISAWSKVYKKELWDSLLFPEGILYEDLATTPYLFLKYKPVKIKEALYYYNIRPGSIMTSNQYKKNEDILKAFENLFSLFTKEEFYEHKEELEILVLKHIFLFRFYKIISAPKDIAKELLCTFRLFFKPYKKGIWKNIYFNKLSTRKKLRILCNVYCPFWLLYLHK